MHYVPDLLMFFYFLVALEEEEVQKPNLVLAYLENRSKVFSQRYFPKGIFPKVTSPMDNFSSDFQNLQFPKPQLPNRN